MLDNELLEMDLTVVNGFLYTVFGREIQWLIAAEECSELNKAVLKSIRRDKFSYAGIHITPAIIEETAHVMICLNGIYHDMNNTEKAAVIAEIEKKLIVMHELLKTRD